MVYQVKMPKAAMGMNEGIVIEWFAKVEDSIADGDPLLEVEAEKSTFEITASEDGTLRRIYVAAGDAVPPGTVLGIIAEADEDISAIEEGIDRTPVEAEADAAATDTKPGATPTAAEDPSYGGESADRIRASPKARKRANERGIPLAEIDGTGPGDAITVEDVDQVAESDAPEDEKAGERAGSTSSDRVTATPKARRQAREAGIDIGDVTGTGPKGAVTVDDLSGDGAVSSHASETPSRLTNRALQPGDVQERALSGMRQTIAERLGRSIREAVHVTVHRDIPIENALAAADVLDDYVEADATVMDILLVALSATLADHPTFNATFENETIRLHGSQHICIAVNLDEGLVTPVLRDVESRSLSELVAGRRERTQTVLEGEYTSEDLTGGTFTVSNLGGLGVDSFTPVINPPQVAILGVDRIHDTVVERDGSFTAVAHMGLDLSFDHRIVDGADAAAMLETLATCLQEPWPLLLERA